MKEIIFFSKNLKTYLFAFEITQDELARLLGNTGQALGKWIKENRTPPTPTLNQLATILEVSPEDLVNKDLTYHFMAKANNLPMLAADKVDGYQSPEWKAAMKTHLQSVQDQLRKIIQDNDKIMESMGLS